VTIFALDSAGGFDPVTVFGRVFLLLLAGVVFWCLVAAVVVAWLLSRAAGPEVRLSFSTRYWLVGRAFAVGAGLAGLASLSVPWDAPLLFGSIMCGPIAGLWASHDWGPAVNLGWAAGCGLAIAAHPLRPNLLTAIVSVLGVELWVFLGILHTFSGV
jgi:hypothetical protein